MPSPPPLTSLRAFEAAARHLSFTKAARELHVTPAAVSHQIRSLEQHLGVTLFRRTSRSIVLTEQGRLAAEQFRDGFERILRGVDLLRAPDRSGQLTIAVSTAFATRWLVPRLGGFLRRRPGVCVRLRTNGPIDLEQDDVDVAIRLGRGALEGVTAESLFAEHVAPVASPALLRGARVRKPADLLRLPLIQDDSMRRAGRPPRWDEWLKAAGVRDVRRRLGPHFDDGHLALQAAALGQGVALGRLTYAVDDLAARRLRRPFRQVIAFDLSYHLLVPQARTTEPAIAEFRVWLLAEAKRFRRGLSALLSEKP
jgi:LysR family glycine cleavage system transcriptional activator